MTIGIDGNEANVDEQVGVSVYTQNLLYFFQKKASSKLEFRIFLRKKPKQFLPKETHYFRYHVVPGRRLWSQIFLPLSLSKHPDLDVFFSPAHYAPRFCPVPLVVTIHDLAYFYFSREFLKKDLHKLKNWTRYSVKKAARIIAVSQQTKKDIITYYDIPEGNIDVIYNGYEKTLNAKQRTSPNFKFNMLNYILYVGTLQPRKNVQTLIRAFSKFVVHNAQFKLILVGKKGWLYDEIFSLVKDLELEDKIIFTGYISDDELQNLYKNAWCFVMPSLYEGFGIPVLEAMSNKCPVIASSSSSVPEIGGKACLYFDPENEDQLLKLLNSLQSNSKLRANLIRKGLERVKFFSWEKCAEKTLTVLKNTVG